MKIKDTNNIPSYKKMLEELFSYKILIGIFGEDDSEILMIAGANEFGADIRPENGRFLTIPLSKKAKGKNPRDFPDLFVLHAQSGELFLVKEKGESDLEFYYWLARSVQIPERSFIRSGWDDRLPNIEDRAIKLLKKVLTMELTPLDYFNAIGEYVVGQLKDYMTKLSSPPNSPITTNNKGSSNPLIDTGRLRDSIAYKVVRAWILQTY